jgi:hypothetical protein
MTRPNERAKIFAEKACWNEILMSQVGGCKTQINALLPYFISGPPLYESANSSCSAVSSILESS